MNDTAINKTPVFTVQSVGSAITPFAVDEDALQHWIDRRSGELEGEVPDNQSEAAGACLAQFVYEANQAGALTGDPRLSFDLRGADDIDGPGFYATLHNNTHATSLIGLTSGWTRFQPYEKATPAAALDYLRTVCTVANGLLDEFRSANGATDANVQRYHVVILDKHDRSAAPQWESAEPGPLVQLLSDAIAHIRTSAPDALFSPFDHDTGEILVFESVQASLNSFPSAVIATWTQE